MQVPFARCLEPIWRTTFDLPLIWPAYQSALTHHSRRQAFLPSRPLLLPCAASQVWSPGAGDGT
jgi:hypothetical protein